jgi:putative ABC transport system permease protein
VETIVVFWPSVAIAFGTLSQSLATGFGLFYEFLKAFMDLAATPMQGLFSFLGITVPKEIAAAVTFGFIAVAAILFVRSSFTRIAFRNVPRRKLRNSLTVLAIILGVALVVGVNISFDSSFAEFNRTISQAAGNVDISIRSTLDEPLNQSLLKTVKAVDGVADASPRISGQVGVLEPNNEWKAATMVGIDSTIDFSYKDTNIMGELPQLRVNSTDAVIDEGLNYSIGDIFKANFTTGYTPAGMPGPQKQIELRVVGIYRPKQSGTAIGNSHTVFIDLVKAQNIFGLEDKIDYIIVKVAEISQTDQAVERIGELGTTYVVSPVKENILTQMSQASTGFQSGLQIMSVLTVCVAIVIILNTIYLNVGERTFEIGILRSIGSSRRQIFWLFFSESMALGTVGVITGLALGIPLAQGFTSLSSMLSTALMPPATNLIVKPWNFVLGAAIGLAATAIGGLFPSTVASRIDIIRALRPSIRKSGKPRTALKLVTAGAPITALSVVAFMYLAGRSGSGGFSSLYMLISVFPLLMVGLICLAAGLLRALNPVMERVLILFGRNRKIISRNIGRNLIRSTICFTLIGMTLSPIIVVAGVQSGVVTGLEDVIHSFYSADLTVTSQNLLKRSFATNLTQIDNGSLVANTAPVLIVPGTVILSNNMSTETKSRSMVLAIDSTYSKVMSMKFSEETPTTVLTTLDTAGTIILTSPLAKSLNAAINTTLKMQTISQNTYQPTWVSFRVVGIAVGSMLEWEHGLYSSPLSEACYISYASLNTSFPQYSEASDLFFIKIRSGQNVNHLEDRIMGLYGSENLLSTLTVDDALGPAKAGIDSTFTILNAVVMFAVVNAAIGVAAIMVMNITERRREIGIERSLGMSRFQVITSIIGEAWVLAITGFLVGTAAGLILYQVTISFMRLAGFPIPFTIPFNSIWLSLLLAVLASLISAAYPAYRASKLNIIEALRRLA